MINALSISYPDFKMHEVIDPEEFDINNLEVQNKVNEIRTVLNQITDSIVSGGSGADAISLTAIAPFTSTKLQAFLNDIVAKLQNATPGQSGAEFISSAPISGVTGTSVFAQLASLKTLLDVIQSGGLDGRYYTETEVDTKLNTKANVADVYDKTQVYNKAETDLKIVGVDTKIYIESFTITSSDNGDGTFSYTEKGGGTLIGTLTPEGYQTFTLMEGVYQPGLNRMECRINDTLHRSVASGGLREDTPDTVTLTVPEGVGAEITFKYFGSVFINGMSSNAYVGSTQPISANYPVGFLWIQP